MEKLFLMPVVGVTINHKKNYDILIQTKQKILKKKSRKNNSLASNPNNKVSITFAQLDRLGKLPNLIERNEKEIAKLEEFLSQENLFNDYPEKFQKATDGLIERHEVLANLENEWIELESLSQEV